MNVFEHLPFGRHLRLSVRGASHGPAIAFRLEGLPDGFSVDEGELAEFMSRRAPGRDALSTARRETDAVEFAFDGGTVDGLIRNVDVRPGDYGAERTVPRPGHADFGQWIETGRIPTGGGANSGRLTAAYCAAGGICRQLLAKRGISVAAKIVSIGGESDPRRLDAQVCAARNDGDSVGGVIECAVSGVKAGIGGALFAGLDSELSAALFAIPGVKGVEVGNGFEAAKLRGSENNDAFVLVNGEVRTRTNRHGGILGGRTSGMPIVFRVAFKPTPTVFTSQRSVDLATGAPAKLAMRGRHDPCVVRRAVPVVEAVSAFVIADALLADENASPRICLTLTGGTIEEDVSQYASQRYFSDMVELRVDLLKPTERVKAEAFCRLSPVPVIVTFRRKRDGGAFGGDEAIRKRFFTALLSCRKVSGAGQQLYVDFEDDFRDERLTALARKGGVRIIRSLHDFTGKPGNLVRVCRRLRGGTDEIPKVAFMPKSLSDVSGAFAETCDFRDIPHVICAMGASGLATRILACRTGSLLTYASVGGLRELGHISPQELVRTYRFRQQTPDFSLYGVTGWPLKSTSSPEINNAAWCAADDDSVMIPFPSKDVDEAMSFMHAMGMRGLAVTIPHKVDVMRRLGRVDPVARKIGAVNTVVLRVGRSQTYVGYNTDSDGFSEAIRHFVGRDDFSGLRVAVLGAGGASKAVVHALRKLHAKVSVFHRSTPGHGFDLIVNATPVDPIPDYSFVGFEHVYDLVYVPEETPLIARARAAGCRVENGFSMLVAQAAEQRRIWRMV